MIRDDEVPNVTLASRAAPQVLGARRTLLWHGLHRAGPPDRAPEIWAQLRNQAPLAAPPDGPLFSAEPLGITPPFALFAPNMGITQRLRDVFGDFLRAYARGASCVLEADLIMSAIHLFLRVRWRRDAIALDLSVLDQLQPDMLELPQRRKDLMLDCGLGKARPRGARWMPLDATAAWDWGQVRWVYMLVWPSIQFPTVRDRVGNLESLKRTGHWVLAVYDRQTSQVMLYDSKQYTDARDREAHVRAVWSILVGYGMFSAKLVVDPTITWEARVAEWERRRRGPRPGRPRAPPAGSVILATPEERVRIAYSQAEDWECGWFVIHMARVLLEGRGLWEAWASPETKKLYADDRAGRLTTDTFLEEFGKVTVPQRQYVREALLRTTIADFVAYLQRMRASGLWNIP